MVSRNLNQLKFFLLLFISFFDTNATCLRLETFDQAEVKIEIKSPMDCQTKNVIYELHCTKDSLSYIGETSKTAETRFVGHLNTILQDCHSNTKTPVGQHFRSPGHSHTDIQVTPIEKIKSRNHFVRKAREAFLIDKYQLLTNGLNRKL